MKITFIKRLYSKKDSMHNFNHILRIKKKIAFLKKGYSNINKDKLNFLIYFHGLKDYVNKNKVDFPKEYIIALNRHTKNPKTIEEKLVFDANMLDNVGKFGIKKCLTVGKQIGRTKKESIKLIKKNMNKIKFYTKKGKELGNKGVNIMNKFLEKRR